MRLILPVLLSLLLSLPARAETVDETYFAATLAYKTQDYDQAFALMQAAAQAGHPGAQYWLGNMYQQGHGTPKSVETAAQWMLRAAQNDHPQAIPNLTARYETGTGGLPQDSERAFHWALKGAQMGLPPSIQDVIRYYRQGRGTAVDLAQVVHWEQIAATAGDKNSQYNMGYYYDAGYGPLRPDGAKAVTWYSRAMAQGQVMAAENLGKMYYHGNGIPKDPAKALEIWKKAAELGSVTSAFNVGTMLQFGNGVPRDIPASIPWHERAADKGYTRAIMALGDIYFNGEGDLRDLKRGAQYYERAALTFEPRALYILGQLYYYGEVKPQDDIRAWVWLAYAAANGYGQAQPFLTRLDGRMSETDKQAASDLAERCYTAEDYAPCL